MKTLFKHQKSTFKRIFKKHKFLLRSIAVSLVLALLFTSLPMDGIIALAEQAIEDSKLITVVEELEEYRTEFSKTYLKSDGTLEAVVSSNPIHFNEDGEWVEIDSTLETAENEKGEEILQNKKGSFNVELPAELQNSSEIAIEKGENKISIKLLETKKSEAKKNNEKKEKAEKLTKSQRKRMTAGELFEADNNQSSAVEYTSAYNDTNIRYDVTPNEVKESIVLQKAPNKKATYSYEITADGLTAILNEDNSIDFFEGSKMDGAEPVFSMPAPHMFDSNNEYSYDIATTLENKNGKYLLTYKPSYDWLKSKERAYPVTVDPTVVVNSGIQDSYTFSGEGYKDSYTGYEQQLKVGTTAWIAPNDYWQTYLKFTDLPQIPYEDYRIDSAYLMLTPKATTGGWEEMELGVYELTEDWKNHQTGKVAERITFNNAPADVGYSTAAASVARGSADNGVGVGFEIAHLVEKWYDSPETNFGLKLAAHLEASQWNDNLVFHSSRSQTGTAPYLSLTYTEYVPVTGIEITNKPTDNKWQVGYYMPVHSLKALVYPENATNKEVIWESSDENVGYMESYGLESYFNPVSLGTTTITAKSADNNEIIDSFDLEVYNIPIETITITNLPENDTLETGSTHQLSIIATPDDASDKKYAETYGTLWSSSDETVAAIDRYGVITANSRGTTIITAKFGGFEECFTLAVKDPFCDEVELLYMGDTVVLFEHEQYHFSAEAKYQQNSVNAHLSYSSSNTDVVSFLENNTMVANSVGTATVTVSVTDYPEVFRNVEVTVVPIQSAKIANLPENNSIELLNKNHCLELEITANNYSDTENDPVHGGRFFEFFEWSSSNPDIATIDAEGYIWPHAVGTTVITVKRPNGGEVLDSFTLNINAIKATDIWPYIQPIYNPMFVGEVWSFEGRVEPENTTDKRTVCISSNPNVVRVDSIEVDNSNFTQHTITALSEGSATIRLEAYDDSTVCFEFVVDVSTFDKEIGLNLPYYSTLYTGETWQISTNPNATIYVDGEHLVDMGDGYIKAVKAGATSFSIYARDNTQYFVCREITVIQSYDLEINNIPTLLDDEGKEYNGIKIGDRYESLGVTITPTPPTNAEIVWSSSDKSIAEVYYDYVRARVVLIGKSQGTVTIYADITGENICGGASFELRVIGEAVTGFGIDAYSPLHLRDGELYLGEEGVLTLDVFPKDPPAYFSNVNWFISNGNKSALTFEKDPENLYNVKIIPTIAGEIEVSAKINNIEPTSDLPITIKAPSATIKNKPSNNTLHKGDMHTLKYTSDPQNVTVTWQSSNSSIAEINKDSGIIDANSVGSVTISVKVKYGTFAEITDSFTLNVLGAGVIISGDYKETLTVSEKIPLTAKVFAGGNASQEVVWSTDDPDVATVDQNGIVTAHALGEVIISAKSKQYDYAIDTAYFEVVPKIDEIIIENKPTNALEVDQEYLLKVSVEPSNAIDKEVVFSSNNDAIYINPNTGKISVLGAGKAIITVKLKSDNSIRTTCSVEGMYSYGFSVQDAYPLKCEMKSIFFDGNYDSFSNYANNINSKFTNFMIKKFDYRGEDSFAFDLKNKEYFGTVVNRPNIDNVDLMIYTGHGYAKNRDKEEGLFQYNSIHFGHHGTPSNVIPHDWKNGTNSEDNFTTKDASHFGQGAKSKWLLAYTCNFLNTKQGDPYVNSLLDNGGRLIMGMGTKSYVVPDEGTMFSTLLTQGNTFKYAFCEAGKRYQDLGSDPEKNNRSAKKYRIMYYGPNEAGTLNDTITGLLKNVEKTETKMFEKIINKYDFNDFQEY